MGAGDGLTFRTTTATTPDDGLDFEGYPQPPEVPPDPTGENWRGPQGEPGEMGPQGPARTRMVPLARRAPRARLAQPVRMVRLALKAIPARRGRLVRPRPFRAHKGQREPPGHKVRKAIPARLAAAARPAMRRRSRMAQQRLGTSRALPRGDHIHPTDTSRFMPPA